MWSWSPGEAWWRHRTSRSSRSSGSMKVTSSSSSARRSRVPAALRARLRVKGLCSRTSIASLGVVHPHSESCMRYMRPACNVLQDRHATVFNLPRACGIQWRATEKGAEPPVRQQVYNRHTAGILQVYNNIGPVSLTSQKRAPTRRDRWRIVPPVWITQRIYQCEQQQQQERAAPLRSAFGDG